MKNQPAALSEQAAAILAEQIKGLRKDLAEARAIKQHHVERMRQLDDRIGAMHHLIVNHVGSMRETLERLAVVLRLRPADPWVGMTSDSLGPPDPNDRSDGATETPALGDDTMTDEQSEESERLGAEVYQLNSRALDDAGVPHLPVGGDEAECFTSKRIRYLAAERDRYRDEAEAAKAWLVSCPWCGEAMNGRPVSRQISHLIEHGDHYRTEARTLAADLGRLRAALEKVRMACTGLSGALPCRRHVQIRRV